MTKLLPVSEEKQRPYSYNSFLIFSNFWKVKGKAGEAGCEVSHEATELDHQSNCNIKEKNAAEE